MSSSTDASPTRPGFSLPQRQIWLLVGSLMVGTFLSILDVLVVITAIPTIVGDLGGRSQLSWIINAYLLTSTAAGPLIGKLGDQFGRKRLYQASIGIFVAGSVLSGLSQSMVQLIVARAVQGVGAGGLAVLPMAIIGDVVPLRHRAGYQGVMSLNVIVASVAGPLVGGLFVDHLSWRWAFFVNVPMGVLAVAAIAGHKLPVRRPGKFVFDLPGSLLLVAGSTAALLALTWGGSRYGWGSATIVALFALVAVCAVLLVVQERRAAEPVLPPLLFRNARFMLIVSSGFLHAITMNGAWVLMPIFLQVVTGSSATNSGALLLPFMIANCFCMVLSGRLASRWARFKVFPLLGTAIATVGFFLYTTMDAHTSRLTATLFMMVTGTGIGLMLNVAVVLVQGSVGHRDLGVATAGLTFFRSLGQTVGTAIALSIYNSGVARWTHTLLRPAQRAAMPAEALQGSPTAIRALPADLRVTVIDAFARAMHTAFVWLLPSAVIAIVVFLFVKELRHDELERAIEVPGPGPDPLVPAGLALLVEGDEALA